MAKTVSHCLNCEFLKPFFFFFFWVIAILVEKWTMYSRIHNAITVYYCSWLKNEQHLLHDDNMQNFSSCRKNVSSIGQRSLTSPPTLGTTSPSPSPPLSPTPTTPSEQWTWETWVSSSSQCLHNDNCVHIVVYKVSVRLKMTKKGHFGTLASWLYYTTQYSLPH